jgi:demethylmenaquinone methyltransferase/2-methoxy-6-polyprenyl-1,4-benzoquinol methylase
MFDGVARRYDALNDLLSFGLDRWWRRQAVRAAPCPPEGRVLDLGCGTGKLGALVAGRCRVVGVDVSGAMLHVARRSTGGTVRLVQGSAFRLPFGSGTFDVALSGFVLRNLSDLRPAFEELARVLRPGALVSLIDLTEPRQPAFRKLFDLYFRTATPALGALTRRSSAYRYLVASLGQIPPPEVVAGMLTEAGFVDAKVRPLTGGVATLFTARR